MQNWKKNRNFRKYRNADGTFTFIITVDGEKVEVSEDIYNAYAEGGYKMEHMEHSVKNSRYLQNSNGKAVRDEHGSPIMLPEREVSLDKLVGEDWDFASLEPSLEDDVLERMQIATLHNCLDLLSAEERELIDALFFNGMTIREFAELTGKSKSKVDRQKTRILGKLKIFLSN